MAATRRRLGGLVRLTPDRWYRRLELADDYEYGCCPGCPGSALASTITATRSGHSRWRRAELQERTGPAGGSRSGSGRSRHGSVRRFGPRHVHDVANASAEPAVTVHAYSPPLTAMRRYEMTASGLVLTDRARGAGLVTTLRR